MVTLPGGRFCSFCFCAAVFGVIVLKPAATSMLSLFCVLVCVVVVQPTMAIATASTKVNRDLNGCIEPNVALYAPIAILDLSPIGAASYRQRNRDDWCRYWLHFCRACRRCSASSMVVAKNRAAAVHALFLVRVGR